MKFTIDTRRFTATYTKKATVLTNDPEHPRESLVCTGSVKVPCKLDPPTLRFNEIDRAAQSVHKTIKITRGDGGPLAPELLPVGHKNVQTSLREIEPGERYELNVNLTPPWPRNRVVQANLKLKTGVPEAPEEAIRIYARVAARLRALPSRFVLPASIPSELERKVRLAWSGGEPGKILEATSSDPQTSVSVVEENNQQIIVLHVPAGYSAGGRRGAVVTIKTDDPEVPLLRVPVYAPRVVARLRAVPRRFIVSQNLESDLELRARLVWSGSNPGKALTATSSDARLSVRLEENSNRQYVVLHVPAGYAAPADAHPFVTVTTDDPKAPTLRVQVYLARPRQVPRASQPAAQARSGAKPSPPDPAGGPPPRPTPKKPDE